MIEMESFFKVKRMYSHKIMMPTTNANFFIREGDQQEEEKKSIVDRVEFIMPEPPVQNIMML